MWRHRWPAFGAGHLSGGAICSTPNRPDRTMKCLRGEPCLDRRDRVSAGRQTARAGGCLNGLLSAILHKGRSRDPLHRSDRPRGRRSGGWRRSPVRGAGGDRAEPSGPQGVPGPCFARRPGTNRMVADSGGVTVDLFARRFTRGGAGLDVVQAANTAATAPAARERLLPVGMAGRSLPGAMSAPRRATPFRHAERFPKSMGLWLAFFGTLEGPGLPRQ